MELEGFWIKSDSASIYYVCKVNRETVKAQKEWLA
jgi:hypothetical protein